MDLMERTYAAERAARGRMAAQGSDLAADLKGRAIELWSDAAGGRLFIVADERDVMLLNQRRGEVLTANELRQVVKIRDPESAAEVLLFKRELDGRIAAVSGGGGAMELKTDADVSNKSRPWRLGRAGTARGYRTTRDTPATPWRPTEREG